MGVLAALALFSDPLAHGLGTGWLGALLGLLLLALLLLFFSDFGKLRRRLSGVFLDLLEPFTLLLISLGLRLFLFLLGPLPLLGFLLELVNESLFMLFIVAEGSLVGVQVVVAVVRLVGCGLAAVLLTGQGIRLLFIRHSTLIGVCCLLAISFVRFLSFAFLLRFRVGGSLRTIGSFIRFAEVC